MEAGYGPLLSTAEQQNGEIRPGLFPKRFIGLFSKPRGKGERGRAGKASGTPNEEKVNNKARYDPKKKKWWAPDQNGKRKYLGPGFKPSPEQMKKAGLAMAGAGAAAGTAWTVTKVLESLGTLAEAAL